jgi:hypothetical protein
MKVRATWLVIGATLTVAALSFAGCGGKGIDATAAGATGAGASGVTPSSAGAGPGAAGITSTSAGAGGLSAAAGAGTCDPKPLGGWTPVWTPPLAPILGACTAQQISTEVGLCVSGANLNRDACNAFALDPTNETCLGCLFTTTDKSKYGAVTIDPSKYLQTNVPGCIAEVDGDLSANGCGAKAQAYSDCLRMACEADCWRGTNDAAYGTCRTKASAGDCHAEQVADVCENSPKYASCNGYSTLAEYFLAIGGLFCTTGFGTPAEGGAAGATQ